MSSPTHELRLQTAIVDLAFLKVVRHDDPTPQALTETEGAILRFLVDNAHRDVDRQELLDATNRGGQAPSARAIDIAVARLRAKLGEPKTPNHIRTVRGVGYRFVGGAAPRAAVVPVVQVTRPSMRVATGRIDLDRRLFYPDRGDGRPLGKLDVDLLERLWSGAAVPRDRLIREIWGRGSHDRSLTAALRRLRGKLDDDAATPRIVVSLPGSAVRLERAGEDWAQRTNLRPQRTTFIDRPEARELAELLTGGPLVTVRGPAGMGKTRLAYEVGLQQLHEHPEIEVWFCDLTCALGEQGIIRAVEQSLAVTDPAPDSKSRILRVLAGKPSGTLLVLDNFDQVTHHTTPLEEWLARAPNVRFLATSRHALGLPNERCLDVGPLDVEGAANLFADRALPARAVDPQSLPVRTLVQHLDCLPLAIELAAARATDFTAEDLLARLNDRLNWLVRPPAGVVSPHRSLRGALDWSWDLLNDDARTALAECAVFARHFTTELARGVLSVPAVASTLAHLSDRSLLNREDGGWRMYEGIREYAREKAILLGLWDRTIQRHAELCMRLATDAAGRLNGRTLTSALTDLRQLRDDLLAIHARASQPILRMRAAVALCPLLEIDGERELASSVVGDALKLGPPPEIAWRLWVSVGFVARLASRYDQAIDALRNAIHAAAQVGEHPRAIAACELAFALCDARRASEAEPMLHEALAVFRAVGDRAREGDALRYLAIHAARGADEAVRQLERVRVLVEETGDPLRALHTHRELVALHLRRFDLDAASAAIADALRCVRQLKLRRGECDAMRWMAVVARHRGDLPGAARLLEEGMIGYDALGEDGRAQLMRRLLALVLLEAGELDRAEQILVQACAEPEEDGENRVADLGNLAIVWHMQGRLDAAIAAWQRLAERTGSGRLRAPVLGHLAAAFADDGQAQLAAHTLAQARSFAATQDEPFLGLCGVIVELGRARAGEMPVRDAIGHARAELQAVTRPGPGGGPSLAQRDQDVNILRRVVERALASTERLGSVARTA